MSHFWAPVYFDHVKVCAPLRGKAEKPPFLLLETFISKMSRPELQSAPELFYDDKMSRKYNSNSRMVGIQAEISDRCIELLNIPVRSKRISSKERITVDIDA